MLSYYKLRLKWNNQQQHQARAPTDRRNRKEREVVGDYEIQRTFNLIKSFLSFTFFILLANVKMYIYKVYGVCWR